jgi:hypothetical protein
LDLNGSWDNPRIQFFFKTFKETPNKFKILAGKYPDFYTKPAKIMAAIP